VLKLLLSTVVLILVFTAMDITAADWPVNRIGDKTVWDKAFDAETNSRLIPM
jgi:hypothetical protein